MCVWTQLSEAIKRVYASTFSQHAKAYVRATPYRLEEEKMAVILQQVVGAVARRSGFYPDFSGVVRSHNFYPVSPMTFADGIAAVALGLGRAVVDGGKCLTFCPRYPRQSAAVFFGGRHSRQYANRVLRAGTRCTFRQVEVRGCICAKSRFGLDVAEKRRHTARGRLDLLRRQPRGVRRAQPSRSPRGDVSRPC